MNRVGDLQYVGYTLFAVTAAVSLGFIGWVYTRRDVRVIKVSQPRFLVMIAAGVLIMASCMIPLGMDDFDNGGLCIEEDDMGFADHCRIICMAVPWTFSMGFVLTFSAMYSKTRRVNAIFHSNANFSRMKVSEKDVLMPFFVLTTINATILICWSVIDPLTYQREADHSRDEWNRVISTFGICKSDNASYFVVPLILVNVGVLIMANWQSYEARNLEEEFAESKYIFICMASMLQAMISGMPILFFVQDMPQAYYMVFVLLCFIICMVILLVMFVPKIIYTHQFLRLSPELQKQYMAETIRKTAKASSSRVLTKDSSSKQFQENSSSRSRPFQDNSASWQRPEYGSTATPPTRLPTSISQVSTASDCQVIKRTEIRKTHMESLLEHQEHEHEEPFKSKRGIHEEEKEEVAAAEGVVPSNISGPAHIVPDGSDVSNSS